LQERGASQHGLGSARQIPATAALAQATVGNLGDSPYMPNPQIGSEPITKNKVFSA
jgi:hypothetical protein